MTPREGGPAGEAAHAVAADAGGASGAGNKVTRQFPAACRSVALARQFLLEQLGGDHQRDVGLLALMISELATNAVQYADTDFEVGIMVTPQDDGRCVHVRVTDEAPGFPTPQAPPADAANGRGLRIVESLADAWGIEVQRGRPGKTVWFTARVGPEDAGTCVLGEKGLPRDGPSRCETSGWKIWG